ncbi:sigma-70 family RNA polymerase sigma factor [Peribacillus alkalitolerans]|uniref:sigma-70 family RNA polymerase sigma factor n=1 Tax=Peribacillus alkalitolerans TaxID=1550385 RepID=UPI0013D8163D|nr:sigma-70 family RNA polymerase sigma factor [Peribacillus alkalitolerans]
MDVEGVVRRAQKGDDVAFLEVMNFFKIDLYKMAFAFLKNQEDAVEAVQEVTYRAYKSIRQLKEPTYCKTWILRIMMNYCNDSLKNKKRMILDEKKILLQGKESDYSFIEIEEAMNLLDERSREIIALKYFHDLRITDIAIIMDCPEGTVKTWLYKALKALRGHLGEEKGGVRNV